MQKKKHTAQESLFPPKFPGSQKLIEFNHRKMNTISLNTRKRTRKTKAAVTSYIVVVYKNNYKRKSQMNQLKRNLKEKNNNFPIHDYPKVKICI